MTNVLEKRLHIPYKRTFKRWNFGELHRHDATYDET